MVKQPDDIDHGIIKALQNDPQVTNKAIASLVGVSESTVAQRIRDMSDNNIMRVVAQRDVYSDGYTLMCLSDVDTVGDAAGIAARIALLDEAISVSRCIEAPQILVNVRARDRAHLNTILFEKIGSIPGIERIRSNVCMTIIKMESGYGELSTSLRTRPLEQMESKYGEITRILLEDGRTSNREIARRLDISEGSVRQRIKKMYDTKQMQLRVVCDPVSLNQAAIAIVRIASRPTRRADAIERLTAHDAVTFVGTMTGAHDLWALVQMQDSAAIADFCDEVVSTLDGIKQYRVTMLIDNFLHRHDLARIR
ncbi:AsnC family transcriptional regulator [Hyphomonas johnsonii MHS-2]|uniref:AsnC family transcriptional regulator n=1 Tax=Hyphomonas johnsonii MHS-2 TaxID=1280950 RepID=A0A059FNF1_9PROT|nr:AsnC family transcriptional regulator [Hyphomonas johnsonii MHS-2]